MIEDTVLLHFCTLHLGAGCEHCCGANGVFSEVKGHMRDSMTSRLFYGFKLGDRETNT